MTKYITLDWDNIGIDEEKKRIDLICKEHPNFTRLVLSFSPTKGWHCRVNFNYFVHNASLRRRYKDDGRRLVNDLLNRDNHAHNILWTRKVIQGKVYKSQELIVITNPTYYQNGLKVPA